jgi:hypothetical protein
MNGSHGTRFAEWDHDSKSYLAVSKHIIVIAIVIDIVIVIAIVIIIIIIIIIFFIRRV